MKLKYKSRRYYPIFRQYTIKTPIEDLIPITDRSTFLSYHNSSKTPKTWWVYYHHVKSPGWPCWYNTFDTKFKRKTPYYRSKKHCHILCKDIGCTCGKYAVKYTTSKSIKTKKQSKPYTQI